MLDRKQGANTKKKLVKWSDFILIAVLFTILYPSHLLVNAANLLGDTASADSPGLSLELDLLPSPAPETNGPDDESIDSSGQLIIVSAP